MQFLENYPYSLRIMFSLLLISIICYFVNIMVVLYTKAYNMFAIRYQNDQTLRLFLYFWFSQLCIVIPQFVVPFLTNSEGDPTSKDIISEEQCQIQGAISMFGWISGSLLSLYIEYCVLQILQGENFRKNWIDELKWIGSIYSFSFIPNLFFALEHKAFGWNDSGKDIYQFCMLKLDLQNFLFILTEDLVLLSIMIYLSIQIFKRQRILRIIGVIFDHPILNAYYLSVTHVLIWTFTAFLKVLDKQRLYQGKQIPVLWQIFNLINGFEAIIVTFFFFHFYLPFLRLQLGKDFYLYFSWICCCRKQQNQTVLGEYITKDVFSESDVQSSLTPRLSISS